MRRKLRQLARALGVGVTSLVMVMGSAPIAHAWQQPYQYYPQYNYTPSYWCGYWSYQPCYNSYSYYYYTYPYYNTYYYSYPTPMYYPQYYNYYNYGYDGYQYPYYGY